MNVQEKMFKTTADFRTRTSALASVAFATARARAKSAGKRVDVLKGSFAALTVAGRELDKVARRHAARFVKQNSVLATDAGKDVAALARSTYASLANRSPKKRIAHKSADSRKRSASRAA